MDKSLVTLERMRSFMRVAERGNLSAVAREFGVGQSTITRQLRELEEGLGVRLVSRTTRSVSLTDEGARYLSEVAEILRLVDEASDRLSRSGGRSAGRVRVSCTAALGVRHVCRHIFAFQDREPQIEVDLGLTDERVDLVQEGVDLALRLGPLADSSMLRRTVGLSRRVLVAAKDYLAAHGRPTTAAELAAHQGIRMTNVAGSGTLVLESPDGQRHSLAFGGRFRTDHGLAVREALVARRGIAPTHLWLVDDLLASGELEVILPDHRLPPVPISLLIVPERSAVARVRLLIDHLVQAIAGIPGIER
ncbi:LysR family transcriptional regulator [Aureimonas endophytica]|uniref:LysR family transcriptional regulator n=1 Tax=Aureimonas endophytica TaxID=2027858 RepID=A0A917E3A3_9HYPH|nr:LysR family transcriptional regulator [Aureimonas endophytica]GGE00860.1 LysR family transcriptional regulator [Aureimonas endophytica]